VLPRRDHVHPVRHRDGVPHPVGGAVQGARRAGARGDRHLLRRPRLRARVPVEAGRSRVGLESWLQEGVLTTRVDEVIKWGRKNSLWPMPFGVACCAIEMMATLSSRYDLARFGSEAIRFSPRQADLMIVSGRISLKMMPVLTKIWEQMP